MFSQGNRKRPHSQTQKQKKCANPIFEQWICEWRDDAAMKNNKLQFVYSKALSSLRRYPLPLGSGRECLILEYFGPVLCQKIDKRITQEPDLILHGSAVVASLINLDTPYVKKSKMDRQERQNSQKDDDDETEPVAKKQVSKRKYVPIFRSGAYALLITLFKKEETQNYRGYMLKTELQHESQDHCDTSMTNKVNGNYTAWSAMAGLITKNLIIKMGNPVKYLLTVEGRELAGKLLNADKQSEGVQESSQSQLDSDCVEIITPQRVRFQPGEFEVILCIDTSETTAKFRKQEVVGELQKNGVPLEVIKLNVGDFVWICRKIQRIDSATSRNRLSISRANDMVLPYVIERKRHDDLASSIRDGRFHEQKHRLEQTGLQPTYLIEAYGSGDHGLADGALRQAIANTQITNQFIIHETVSLKDTCAYLTHMTRFLAKMYQGKTVSCCTKEEWNVYKAKTNSDVTYLMSFIDFNEFGTKSRNWTVSEMFARHLMKLRGLSAERAFAIIQKYPTLTNLIRAYGDCQTNSERDTLLSSIRYGTGARTIGPAISKAIHSLYSWGNST